MSQQNDCHGQKTEEKGIDQIISIYFSSFEFYASFCPLGAPSHQRIVQDWEDTRASSELNKNLSSLLIDKETKETVAMGYEADELYTKAQEKKEDDKYMYFQHFMPYLYNKDHLEQNIPVFAADGESTLMLEDLITKSLVAAMQHCLSYINGLNRIAEIDEINKKQVFWVVSVPAIWDEMSKEMMKYCARKAGMKHFELALEPIVSIYHVLNAQGKDFRLRGNDNILLLDCRERTVDASFINIGSSIFDSLEIYYCDSVRAGGLDVDRAFVKLLKELLPHDVIDPIITSLINWKCTLYVSV